MFRRQGEHLGENRPINLSKGKKVFTGKSHLGCSRLTHGIKITLKFLFPSRCSPLQLLPLLRRSAIFSPQDDSPTESVSVSVCLLPHVNPLHVRSALWQATWAWDANPHHCRRWCRHPRKEERGAGKRGKRKRVGREGYSNNDGTTIWQEPKSNNYYFAQRHLNNTVLSDILDISRDNMYTVQFCQVWVQCSIVLLMREVSCKTRH